MNLLQYIICAAIIYLIIKRDDILYEVNRMENCRSCGMSIDSTSLFCPNCHDEIKKVCDNCGKLLDIDWRFCPFCENNESTERYLTKK